MGLSCLRNLPPDGRTRQKTDLATLVSRECGSLGTASTGLFRGIEKVRSNTHQLACSGLPRPIQTLHSTSAE